MVSRELFKSHIDQKIGQLDEVLQKHQFDTAIIPSGIPKPVYWDDNYYPFKANFHFSLFVPVGPLPHSYLVYQSGEKPTLIFYQPADYWHVVPTDPDPIWADQFKIIFTTNPGDWLGYMPKDLGSAAWIGEPQEVMPAELPIENINHAPLVHELHYYRAIKNDYEINRLARANQLAAQGHLAARDKFLAGGSELDIHLAYLAASRHTEQELPYGNIVALGPHNAILHYTELEKVAPEAQYRASFLIDAGAVSNHYCADITRTWSTDDEFINMIGDFDLLEQEIVAEVKPGVDYVELHKVAHQKIAGFMASHDLLTVTAEQAYEEGVTSTFFPHGLGHLLGLQVHDIGGHQKDITGAVQPPPEEHPYLRLTRTLEPGYCVTIEPGMYFIDLLMDKLKATPAGNCVNWTRVGHLKHFGGIRIEDDVVVTEYGHENLSRQAFQQLTTHE